MKRLTLKPEQIIVPGGYEIGDEEALKKYFEMFDKGCEQDVPPVLVLHSNLAGCYDRCHLPYPPREEFLKQMKLWRALDPNRPDFFYMIDGNHRAIAATLTHNPISALELQEDGDILEVKLMAERGELPSLEKVLGLWKNSISHQISEFESYVGENFHINPIPLLDLRVSKLVEDGLLPRYMQVRYLKEK